MIHTVNEVKAWHKGTEQIGDTLFVDGTPYISCGVCHIPIRKVDAFSGRQHVVAAHDVRYKELKPYMVTVGYWIPEDSTEFSHELQMFISIRKWKPILRQVNSCFPCWDKQEQEKALAVSRLGTVNSETGKEYRSTLVFYDLRKIEKQEPLKPPPLIKTKGHNFVVKSSLPIEVASRTNNTQAGLMMDIINRYIPIITWHPPLVDVASSYDAVEKAFTTVGHIANLLLKQMERDEVVGV